MWIGHAVSRSRSGFLSLLLLFIVPCFSSTAWGDCLRYENYLRPSADLQVAGFNFKGNAIAFDGTVAYIVGGNGGFGGIFTVDITSPDAPAKIGELYWPNFQGPAITLSGSIAYVADGLNGLKVLSISDPTSPKILGSVSSPNTLVADVAVSGGMGFLAAYDHGVQIVNVSSPRHPSIVGQVSTSGGALAIALAGNLAYVAEGTSGIEIMDLTNALAPVVVGAVNTPGNATELALSGSLLYVADGQSGVQMIDVSNPQAPVIIGSLNPGGSVVSLARIGDTLYMSGNSGLYLVDVSNPSSPQLINAFTVFGPLSEVKWSGTRLFVFPSSQCQVIDPSKLTAIAPKLGVLDFPDVPDNVLVRDNIAYVPGGNALTLVDVSNPASPQVLGSASLPSYSFEVAVTGSTACVAGSNGSSRGMQVIDVSNPQAPTVLTSLDTPGDANGVAAMGSFVYLADGDPGLYVIDVSNPSSPTIVNTVDVPCWYITIEGSKAYVVGYGLTILDLSDPASPQPMGHVDLPGYPWGPAISGNYVYVAGDYEGLFVIDATDPMAPVLVATLPAFDYSVTDVEVLGDYAYILDGGTWGPRVVDVSNPAQPKVIGSMNVPGTNFGGYISNGVLFLTQTTVGLDPAHLVAMNLECEASTVGIDPGELAGERVHLGLAYPNPSSNGSATIPFSLSRKGVVELRILDLAGREVRTLLNELKEQGSGRATWDGRNDRGERVPAGIYFYQLRAPGFEATRKLVRTQ